MQNSCSDSPGLRQLGIQPIRTHLDYVSSVYSPFKIKHIEQLEAIQRRVTRQIPGMKDWRNSSYQPSHIGEYMGTCKVINGIYDRNTTQFVKLWKGMIQRTRPWGNPNRIFSQRATYNIRKYSFAPRMATLWQSLPKETTNAPSINSSKRQRNKEIVDDYRAKISWETPHEEAQMKSPAKRIVKSCTGNYI